MVTTTSTHIRIPHDVKHRLDNLTHEKESIGAVINRIIDFYENMGGVNADVNTPVNSIFAPVNSELTEKLTDLALRVSALEAGRDQVPVNNEVNMPLTECVDIDKRQCPPVTITSAYVPMEEISETSTIDLNIQQYAVDGVPKFVITKNGRVQITPELNQIILDRVSALEAAGMPIHYIEKFWEISETQFEALEDEEIKTLTKQQIVNIFTSQLAPMAEMPVNIEVNAMLTKVDGILDTPTGPSLEIQTIAPNQARQPDPTKMEVTLHLGNEPELKLNNQGAYEMTSEMREHIIKHLDTLRAAGMIDSHIAKEAGFNKSLISFIRDGQQKSIKPDKYRALMAVKPIAP